MQRRAFGESPEQVVARVDRLILRDRKFADLYGAFPVKEFVFGFCRFFVRSGKPFFVPSPAIRFPERAEGVKGPKR